MAPKTVVSVDGHRIELSNLDKVLYPSTGTTKADVLRYYANVAPLLIRHAHQRPATMKRWVNGVGTVAKPHTGFFQKNIEASAPGWVPRTSIKHSDHVNTYPLVNDVATLTWLAQLATLEIHTPQWQAGPRGARRNPDRLVIDLDPGEGVGLVECAAVAVLVRARLRDEGLDVLPVTSGSKGIHLYAQIDGTRTSQQVSADVHELARSIESEHRDLVVSDMAKDLRSGKVFIDWSQNNGSKTTVTPYSLRGRLRPTVAVPRTWDEITSPTLQHLEFEDVLERVRRGGGAEGFAQKAEGKSRASGDDGTNRRADERLAPYRHKRDAAKTPEPMSGVAGASTGQRQFVIQEHHARRLHYDLRIERDGVLVSWALPKGVPTSPTRNHLAVHTEDHPMEYATFEGTIPAGEYGGGSVAIWDAGTVEVHKWRDDEVIATLHGRPGGGLGGTKTVALIHTGTPGENDDHWLIHLMKASPRPEPATIPVRPMLAATFDGQTLPASEWAFEMKWDGIRVIAHVRDGQAWLWTRNGNDITAGFPEIAVRLPAQVSGRDVVLDAEIVALDERGRPDFGRLQQRLGVSGDGVLARAESVPVHAMVFDVVSLDGEDRTALPYEERRALLSVVSEGGALHVPPAFDMEMDDALAVSREHGLEGVVAKRRRSRYRPGKRSPDWLKIKLTASQEVVVVGWLDSVNGGLGSLVVAVPDRSGSLRYAGRVGTGFSERQRDALLAELAARHRDTPTIDRSPRDVGLRTHWVEPELVGEVRFTEWTRAGTMRHPSWLGLRTDKTREDIRPPLD